MMKSVNAPSGRTLEDSEAGDGDHLLYTNTYPYDDLSARDSSLRRSSLVPAPALTTSGKVFVTIFFIVIFIIFGGSCAALAGGIQLRSSVANQQFQCDIIDTVGLGVVATSGVLIVLSLVFGSLLLKGPLRNFFATTFSPITNKSCGRKFCSFTTLIFFMLLAAIIILAGLIAWSFFRFSKQNVSVDPITLTGKDGDIKLIRDENGLPRLHAQSKRDAFFAQGYAQAQDRLWELEFNRLVVQGRLAEFVGKSALKTDKQTRSLGFRRAAEEMCALSSNSSKEQFQSFVDGVNYFMRTQKQRPVEFGFMGKSKMSIIPSMRLFDFYEPEPFDINLVCYSAKLIQWEMAGDAQSEALKFKMWWNNPDTSFENIQQLFSNYSNFSKPILSAAEMNINGADVERRNRELYETFMAEAKNYETIFDVKRQQWMKKSTTNNNTNNPKQQKSSASKKNTKFPDVFDLKPNFASNGWVARSSGTGNTAGASDPHLHISLPSVWYQIHMQWGGTETNPNFSTTGVSLCGMPGIGIGKRSNQLFWAITSGQTDTEDLFVLNQTDDDPDHYYVKKSSTTDEYVKLALTTRTEVIKVLDQDDDVVLNIKESIYGSDATDVFFAIDSDDDSDFTWSNTGDRDSSTAPYRFHIYSPVFRPDSTSADAFAATLDETVITASDMQSKVCDLLAAPAFSISIADFSGGMTYTLTGHHQERNADHFGRWPHFGTENAQYYYKQFVIPFMEKPRRTLSAGDTFSATIATANQKIYPDGFKFDLGAGFSGGYRSRRIMQLLAHYAHDDPTTLDDLSVHKTIQSDHKSGFWLFAVQPAVLANQASFLFDYTKHAKTLPQFQQDAWAKAQVWIHTAGLGTGNFDGSTDVGSTAISFMWRWVQEYSTFAAPLAEKVTGNQYWDQRLMFENSINGKAPKYVSDVLCTNYLKKHNWYGNNQLPTNDMCVQAFVVAMLRTAVRYPNDDNLRWAIDLKPFNAKNRMMSQSPLSCMFDRSIEKDGDGTSIDVSDFSITDPQFESTAASSMRSVYSAKPGQTDFMLFALPGGASGNPYDKRYQNLLEKWRTEQYLNITSGRLN